MSAQHTQGRLHVGEGNAGQRIIYDQRGWAIADAKLFRGRRREGEDIQNARRLVACWNACEGIPTEALEVSPNLEDVWNCVVAQRDELLAALIMVRDADEDCKRDGLQTIPPVPRARIDAAIAKVEGGAT